MNTKQHLVIGAGLGAVLYWVDHLDKKSDDHRAKFDWGECLGHVAICAFGAMVPDIIEPADSPNHRGFFHSVAAAALAVYATKRVLGYHTSRETQRLVFLLAGGYLSHLAADSTTPKSIELV